MIDRLSACALLAVVAAGANPFSLPDGGSGFKLLKTSTSPRSQALSDAGTADPATDPSSNPAVDSASRLELSAGWVQSYGRLDGSYQQADWILPSSDWTWMGRVRYAGFGDIPGRDDAGRSTGTYAAGSWAAEGGLSIPVSVLDGLRAGLLAGGGSESVSDVTDFAGWISAGLDWAPRSLPWAAGLSVQNFGATDGSDRLPAVVQLGVSWKAHLSDWTLVPMADLRLVADEAPVVPVGMEALWNGIALRAGYPVGRPESRPSFGAGYQGDSWGIDVGLGWHAALGFAPSGRLSVRF
jgi:hypothetical protein